MINLTFERKADVIDFRDWNKHIVDKCSCELKIKFENEFGLHKGHTGIYNFTKNFDGCREIEKRIKNGELKYYNIYSTEINNWSRILIGKGKMIAGYKKGDKVLKNTFTISGNRNDFEIWVSFPDYKFLRWYEKGGQHLLAKNQSSLIDNMDKENADLIMNKLHSLMSFKINQQGFIL